MRADAVEGVFPVGCLEEGRHPCATLIDARLERRGDVAGAACAMVVAVARARGADLGAYGAFKVIDPAL